MTSKGDITFIAARLRKAADLLDESGTTAWETTSAWARGAGIASYDPETGGNRWWEDEHGNVYPVPTDPTGDRALTVEEVNGLHDLYRRHLDQALNLADRLVSDVETATPRTPRQVADRDRLAAQVGSEGWCSSCYRNAGRLEPQAMHPNGNTRYQGECRWCHDFKHEHGRYPTLQLLEKRHSGRSITADDIARALGQPMRKAG